MDSDYKISAPIAALSPAFDLPVVPAPELQLIYDTAPIGLAFLSPDCRYLQINHRLTEICGISVADHLGRTVRDTVPAIAEAVESIVGSIMATGAPVTGVEVAGQREDDAYQRWWITHWHPVRGADGKIIGINVAAEEITERKRAEAALQESERQFHTLADSIPQLVWMAEKDGGIFWFNRQFESFAGISNRSYGCDWTVLLNPVEPDVLLRWKECIKVGTPLEIEITLRASDGRYVPFLTRIVPLCDSAGTVNRWIGTHIDISEQKNREQHTRLVVDELSHRTKNLLAVVMAVANQTARHATNVVEYKERFGERLKALAKCHDVLVRDNWQGASFRDLLAVQLEPFQETSKGQIDAIGPPIILTPEVVQYLSLAFHELATNASKHGALSADQGHVSIHWLHKRSETVCVHWHESGGPPVALPKRHGFGRVVVEKIVPQALNGVGALNFSPAGVNWTFEFPMQPRIIS